jgi:ribosome-binding protein aMBF1 (putative translation factor)
MMGKNPHTGSDALEFFRTLRERDPELQRLHEQSEPRFRQVVDFIEARRRAGLTQKQLAERMGVDIRTVWRLESLDHSPRVDALQRAAAALDCDLQVRLVPREAARDTRVAEESPAYARKDGTEEVPR